MITIIKNGTRININRTQIETHNKCRDWKTKLNKEEIKHLEEQMITNTIDLADTMNFVRDNMDDLTNCKICKQIAQKLGVI